jgi:hypothetical protein
MAVEDLADVAQVAGEPLARVLELSVQRCSLALQSVVVLLMLLIRCLGTFV